MSSSSSTPPWRRAKNRADDYVREWEAEEKVSTAVTRRRARLFPASKVAGDLSRRDPLRDAEIFQAIVRSVGVGNAVCFGRGREAAVNKAILSFPELSEEGEDERGRTKHTIWTPDWSHTGDRLKMLSMASTFVHDDGAVAFTVNLDPLVFDAALRSPRGVVGYFSERLTRHLAKHGLDRHSWAFMIEASPLHDAHLHGVLRSAPASALRAALTKVGGHKGVPTGREVDVKPVTNLNGWIAYITKNPLVTRRALRRAAQGVSTTYNGGLLGASRSARSEAARWYRRVRGRSIPIN